MALVGDIARRDVAERQPRLDARLGVARAGLAGPRHRRALRIAAHPRPVEHADRIEHPLLRDVGVGHADLVAVVEERRAAQAHQHHHRGAGLRRDRRRTNASGSGGCRGCRRSTPATRSRAGAARRARSTPRSWRRVQLRVQQREVEREVELVVVAVERADLRRVHHVGLADEHAVRVVAVGELAPPAQHVVHLGPRTRCRRCAGRSSAPTSGRPWWRAGCRGARGP